MSAKRKILILNPNSTQEMTNGLEKLLAGSKFAEEMEFTFANPTSGPSSINNEDDAQESLGPSVGLIQEQGYLKSQDAYIVACYSSHPLVDWLRDQTEVKAKTKPALGIFQASVIYSLKVMPPHGRFGIVSTGKIWESLLSSGVKALASTEELPTAWQRFSGVETTGLTAVELHTTSKQIVDSRLADATHRLLNRGGVTAICLGCAGMAGMNEVVSEAIKSFSHNDQQSDEVVIVDGVLAAVELLSMK